MNALAGICAKNRRVAGGTVGEATFVEGNGQMHFGSGPIFGLIQ